MKHPNQSNRRSAHHNYLAHLEQERNDLLLTVKEREAKLAEAFRNIEELEQIQASLAAALNELQASEKQLVFWLNCLLVLAIVLFVIILVLLS